MNEIVFLLCQKQPTTLKYLLIKHQNSQKQNGSKSDQWQAHLNHLMMLRVHKDRTDALTLVDVANDFVGGERKTKAIIWQIFRERYPRQVLYVVKVNANGKL